jgi:uncharacterized lipoprotein YehR (DUF1307 family)
MNRRKVKANLMIQFLELAKECDNLHKIIFNSTITYDKENAQRILNQLQLRYNKLEEIYDRIDAGEDPTLVLLTHDIKW